MARPNNSVIKTLCMRGNAMAIVIPKQVAQRLGWNVNDPVVLNVCEECLVISRIKLPSTIPIVSKHAQQQQES